MVHKTRHQTRKSKNLKGVLTIPELRRSFDYIENYVDMQLKSKDSKDKIVKDLRKEWSKVFFKELDKKSADAFVSDRIQKKSSSRHRTLRHRGGVAPVNYDTRPGMYLAPGQIPDANGHLPLSDGTKSVFGSFVQYIDKGFSNPEPSRSYDPVPGQTQYPTSVPVGMGDNRVHFASKGGNRNKSRKLRRNGGAMLGSMLSQAFTRPISSSSPPGILQDMQDMWHGKEVGASPDQVQRPVIYSK
jgi:hypothetical protein